MQGNGNDDITHDNNINAENDDDVSVKMEDHDDNHATIDDLNIIEYMNTAQLNTDPENGNHTSDDDWRNVSHHGYNLRPRPTHTNSKYVLTQDGQQSARVKMAKPHANVMMMQMNIKPGMKAFGECRSDAMLKELNQLHERKALLPLRREDMTHEQRNKALRYLMFLKEKCEGTIKARGCADRRSQREYTAKSDTSSPTVSVEAMMMSCVIDTKENSYVAVADIPGAFLHTDMEDETHMLLEGKIAELIVMLDPKLCHKYVWENGKGKPML